VRRLEHNAFKVELAQRVAVRALQPSGARARTPGAVAADVLVRDGRLVMARRNLHIPYVELLACNGLPTLVGDGDYDRVERQTDRRRSSASPRTIDGQTVANSRVKSTV
jgi:hypothetical protein